MCWNVFLIAVLFPRRHLATVLASLPASPGHREPWLATRSDSASTARQILRQRLRKRRKHATTDETSTATFTTHTHTLHHNRPSSPHSTNNLPPTATHETDCHLHARIRTHAQVNPGNIAIALDRTILLLRAKKIPPQPKPQLHSHQKQTAWSVTLPLKLQSEEGVKVGNLWMKSTCDHDVGGHAWMWNLFKHVRISVNSS